MASAPHKPGDPLVRKAIRAFQKQQGMLRMADALRAGISRATLNSMLAAGTVERMSRGLYRLAAAEPLSMPDLAIVAAKIPRGVFCLLSALSFHELTTEIPHEVYVAISRNSEPPRIAHPPVRSFRFGGAAFSEGIEIHRVDSQPLRIYSPEKTLADCFKYRNRIGLDTCLDALRSYRRQRKLNADALLHFADVCRVKKVMQPYLEATL